MPFVRLSIPLVLYCVMTSSFVQAQTQNIPQLKLPSPQINETFEMNWLNTLQACLVEASDEAPMSPFHEPRRPWKVDVAGHYPGWYPGVDVKHMSQAYLTCSGDIQRVLTAWNLTRDVYQMDDGGIKPSTMHNNPQGIWPETTIDGSIVYYPLRTVATIDFLICGDMIYRYTQDSQWLRENLPAMRKAADYLIGWTDGLGVLYSDSYDLDQVYRELDGVAQASAYLAFNRLADLESIGGNAEGRKIARDHSNKLKEAAARYFWNEELGYFNEHLIYNNVCRFARDTVSVTASTNDPENGNPELAIDGVIGIGIDAFAVGTGEAGRHEWKSNSETVGAWIQLSFSEPTEISHCCLFNRTALDSGPGDRFETGRLEFSDGSEPVEVSFNDLVISRAWVSFTPRTVDWVRFTGTKMQAADGTSAGLSEFMVMPASNPYRAANHGMTDTSFAMLAFNVADDARATKVWNYFRENEKAFYEVNGLRAPTWIAEHDPPYGAGELNLRAPYKDCVAMARTWRYDALMRRRMHDGAGIVMTLEDACKLIQRPSGGGVGWFAERYGLGRFQPGDESQANVAKYSEYPAVFNSVIVQEALLGVSKGIDGVLRVDPCVPAFWYEQGFAVSNFNVGVNQRLSFVYSSRKCEVTIEGFSGTQTFVVLVPPGLDPQSARVYVEETIVPSTLNGSSLQFTLLPNAKGKSPFVIR